MNCISSFSSRCASHNSSVIPLMSLFLMFLILVLSKFLLNLQVWHNARQCTFTEGKCFRSLHDHNILASFPSTMLFCDCCALSRGLACCVFFLQEHKPCSAFGRAGCQYVVNTVIEPGLQAPNCCWWTCCNRQF